MRFTLLRWLLFFFFFFVFLFKLSLVTFFSFPLKLTAFGPPRAKAIWDFEGIFCTSRHIPGVKFSGLIHPGILGCAPSAEVLATWNKREGDLIAANKLERIVAAPPEPRGAHAGSADAATAEKVGREGARTIPGRPENGGNCEYVSRRVLLFPFLRSLFGACRLTRNLPATNSIKNLSRGSKVYLPVHVPGAKLSIGDLHFSRMSHLCPPSLSEPGS